MKMPRLNVILLLIVAVVIVVQVHSKKFTIGATFKSFEVDEDLRIRRNNIGAQHMAAFQMAINHVNNRTDGIADNLHPSLKIEMTVIQGENTELVYPSNGYFDGGSAAYMLHTYSKDLVAVIGGDSYEKTIIEALTLNDWGYPVLITESTKTEFSHKSRYSEILRLPPADSMITFALYSVLWKYDWMRVTVFHTNDQLGMDCAANFVREDTPWFLLYLQNGDLSNENIKKHTMTVLSKHSFLSYQTDVSSVIDEAKPYGAQIFVLLMDVSAVARILLAGYKQGLFVDGTQVIGIDSSLMNHLDGATNADSLRDIAKAISTQDPTVDVGEVMKGYMAVSSDPSVYFSTDRGKWFIEKFRLNEPTMSTNSSGYESCDSSIRDNSTLGTSLYSVDYPPSTSPTPSPVCIGINSFQDFHANGSNIHPNIMYTYDAVLSIAEAASSLLYEGLEVSQSSLYTTLTNWNHSLQNAVTGTIAYYSGVASEDYFGAGDRLTDHAFSVQMFDYSTYKKSGDWTFVSIASWISSSGWSQCSTTYWECGSELFRVVGDTSQPPSDMPEPLEVLFDREYRYSLLVLACILLFGQLLSGVFLATFWHNKVIKSSQPVLLTLILTGSLMSCVKVIIVGTGIVDQSKCIDNLWLEHLAFTLIFFPLTLKLWRVDQICNNTSIKRVRISDRDVLKYFLCEFAFVVLLLLLASSLGGNRVKTLSRIDANQEIFEQFCGDGELLAGLMIESVLLIFQVCVIFAAVYYTYRCRNVPPMVNETSSLAPAVLGSVASIVIAATITLTIDMSYDSKLFIENMVFLLAVFGGSAFFWIPKMKKVYQNIHKNTESGKNAPVVAIGSKTPVAYAAPSDQDSNKFKGKSRTEVLNIIRVQMNTVIEDLNTSHVHAEDKAIFCQEQINNFKSMLMIIAEQDDSSSNTSESTAAGTSTATHTRVIPVESSLENA